MVLGVFVSGRGTNLQAIIDAIHSGELKDVEIGVIISNNPKAEAQKIAESEGIPYYILSPESIKYATNMLLARYWVDFILLAGFLKKLPSNIIEEYPNKIINIHPALLPKYGGRGMYGKKVHKAVLDNKEKETGVTIHYVDEEYDHGQIIKQVKVPVDINDTVDSLTERVLEVEHKFLIEVLQILLKRGEE